MIELALVMVIMGIVATLALIKYSKDIAHNDLEKTANNVYIQLRSLRSDAFKWDEMAITKFYKDSIATWVDTNESSSCDNSDIRKVTRFGGSVAIGLPENPPVSGAYGENLTSSGKTGAWADSLTVLPDSRGEYSHGAIYLYNKKLPKFTYCIGITTSMQSLEFYKWDGTWRKQ